MVYGQGYYFCFFPRYWNMTADYNDYTNMIRCIKSLFGRCLRHLLEMLSNIQTYLSCSDLITFYNSQCVTISGACLSMVLSTAWTVASPTLYIIIFVTCVMRKFVCVTWDVISQAITHSFWLCLITQWLSIITQKNKRAHYILKVLK